MLAKKEAGKKIRLESQANLNQLTTTNMDIKDPGGIPIKPTSQSTNYWSTIISQQGPHKPGWSGGGGIPQVARDS